MPSLNDRLSRWRRDPATFLMEALIDPQTGRRFELFEAECVFLKHAFTPTEDGDLPYRDILWSCIKKSGKSTFGALCSLYTVICLGGRFAEAFVIANDYEQSQSRIFTTAARIVEASPLLDAKITADKIVFSNGSFIQALASDYRGGAGVEPTFVIADEIWGFTSESAQRLYEEVCPTPTRKPSVRMVTSYAGFSGESTLLENLVKRGESGVEIAKDLYTQPGLIAFISHERIAPWQSETWLEEARKATRPSAFMRQYENRFTSGETNFIDMADYDLCVDPDARPVLSDRHLPIWVGLDGSFAHDSTGIAAVTFDQKLQKVRVVAHKIFTPSKNEPIDFAIIEAELLSLRSRFALRQVMFDPFQLVALSQRMTMLGLPMEPFNQTSSNLEAAATNLAELIKHHNLVAYADTDIRMALSRTVVVETPRGVRISKSKVSHRIDVIAALSFAAFAAIREGQASTKIEFLWAPCKPADPFSTGSSITGIKGGIGLKPESIADDRRQMVARSDPRWRLRGY